MASTQWVGSDGNRWIADSSGVRSVGPATSGGGDYWSGQGYSMILDPNAGGSGSTDWNSSNANWIDTSGNTLGASTTRSGSTSGTGGTADDISFLNDQEAQLRSLLGRTDTGLSQGLTRNEDEYNTQVGGANNDKARQYANYEDQRVSQNKNKLEAYNTVNRNAGNGYRSLAQIIGRSAGTGSSAYRDLLPHVVGTDTSAKRQNATNTFGENLQGIDKAQGQYDISFAGVLADLMKQKKDNENSLRSGIEGQRQNINQQLAQNAGQRAQAQGGGYAQVKAAQQPFQSAIDNSRNSVENFFNQFRTQYTPTQAVAATPELSQYTTDRAVVNAKNQGAADATNPYANILRKRLQGQA